MARPTRAYGNSLGKPVAALTVIIDSALRRTRKTLESRIGRRPISRAGTVTRTEVGKENCQEKGK